jgi:hypothetical protein
MYPISLLFVQRGFNRFVISKVQARSQIDSRCGEMDKNVTALESG